MSLVAQHKEYEKKEKESGESTSDIEDFIVYQMRVKSETDDYLGIFRVLTVFEIKTSLVLARDADLNEELVSQRSAAMMSPLASFEKTTG